MLTTGLAMAQETVDLGTLRNSEISVVQKTLYPKADHPEISFGLGALVFDPYMVAPKVQLTYGKHMSETMAWEVQVGGGYGIGTFAYRELGGPAYGVRPEAYRYLGSATGGVQWAPIYAKMNVNGERIVHYDVYVPAVAGVTIEQLAWGEKYIAIAPTVGVGIGSHFFIGDGTAVRVELRDDFLVEPRQQSGTVAIKQNVGITVGVSRFLEAQ